MKRKEMIVGEIPKDPREMFWTNIRVNNELEYNLDYGAHQFVRTIFKDVSIKCQWDIRKIEIKWNENQVVDDEISIIHYTQGYFEFTFHVQLMNERANKITEEMIMNKEKMIMPKEVDTANVFIQYGKRFLQ
jgi:hypothetical protein